MKNTLFIGKAGEYRVVSELLKRGIKCAWATVDDGVDILLENGKKIEVKTTLKEVPSGVHHNYQVTLTGTFYKKKLPVVKAKSEKFDFLIVWAVDKDLFLVIPKEEIKVTKTLTFSPKNPAGMFRFKDKWDLLKG